MLTSFYSQNYTLSVNLTDNGNIEGSIVSHKVNPSTFHFNGFCEKSNEICEISFFIHRWKCDQVTGFYGVIHLNSNPKILVLSWLSDKKATAGANPDHYIEGGEVLVEKIESNDCKLKLSNHFSFNQ